MNRERVSVLLCTLPESMRAFQLIEGFRQSPTREQMRAYWQHVGSPVGDFTVPELLRQFPELRFLENRLDDNVTQNSRRLGESEAD